MVLRVMLIIKMIVSNEIPYQHSAEKKYVHKVEHAFKDFSRYQISKWIFTWQGKLNSLQQEITLLM